MRTVRFLTIFAVALLLGCENEKPAAPTAPPVQLQTGRFALQKMLVPARGWAPDAQPVWLQSVYIAQDGNGHDGKYSLWRAAFASPSRQKTVIFIWSGTDHSDMPRGVNHLREEFFNPANRSEQPFDLNFIKIDSEDALETAQKHGGKDLLVKKPNQPVIYLLDYDSRIPQLRWHVIYNDNPAGAPLTVLIDASSGLFIHKE
ncbi:MAG TPA: hypothetical protein VKT33_14170 [Candidatus Angelobacter sp.]|nr:hypothetical protein [Candidatus Angelobacter sp.]